MPDVVGWFLQEGITAPSSEYKHLRKRKSQLYSCKHWINIKKSHLSLIGNKFYLDFGLNNR